MLSAIIKKGALASVLACLAATVPAALAEKMYFLAPQQVNGALSVNRSCGQPDNRTLRAILPVATDHGSYASGVVFDNNRVLTAAHAVQGGGHFYVRVADTFLPADLMMVDHVNDLAVLAVDTQSIQPILIAGIAPSSAQPVWAVGYPRAQAMSTSTGVFQRSRAGALHTSASIDSGQSGGGLLSCKDGNWELLGMLRGYGAYLEGDVYVKLENHSVSVAAATINEFLGTRY